MGKIKYFLFILVIFIVIFFPLFESRNYKIIEYKIKNFIPTVINEGKYYIYEINLTKRGNFKKLEIFSKSKIVGKNFELEDLIQKEKLFAKNLIYTSPYLKGFNVKFQTNDYNLTTNYAIYNKIKKDLTGGKFEIIGNSFKGYGDKFYVDNNKNVTARNIKYFLKVNK